MYTGYINLALREHVHYLRYVSESLKWRKTSLSVTCFVLCTFVFILCGKGERNNKYPLLSIDAFQLYANNNNKLWKNLNSFTIVISAAAWPLANTGDIWVPLVRAVTKSRTGTWGLGREDACFGCGTCGLGHEDVGLGNGDGDVGTPHRVHGVGLSYRCSATFRQLFIFRATFRNFEQLFLQFLDRRFPKIVRVLFEVTNVSEHFSNFS